ncbi:hypothetical protein C8R44DRAFT_931527 [Mycena epipterygia]|nr:hypothetical protein C8R44DRAFT_931527 [Mycena epipterygia]
MAVNNLADHLRDAVNILRLLCIFSLIWREAAAEGVFRTFTRQMNGQEFDNAKPKYRGFQNSASANCRQRRSVFMESINEKKRTSAGVVGLGAHGGGIPALTASVSQQVGESNPGAVWGAGSQESPIRRDACRVPAMWGAVSARGRKATSSPPGVRRSVPVSGASWRTARFYDDWQPTGDYSLSGHPSLSHSLCDDPRTCQQLLKLFFRTPILGLMGVSRGGSNPAPRMGYSDRCSKNDRIESTTHLRMNSIAARGTILSDLIHSPVLVRTCSSAGCPIGASSPLPGNRTDLTRDQDGPAVLGALLPPRDPAPSRRPSSEEGVAACRLLTYGESTMHVHPSPMHRRKTEPLTLLYHPRVPPPRARASGSLRTPESNPTNPTPCFAPPSLTPPPQFNDADIGPGPRTKTKLQLFSSSSLSARQD